MIAAIIPALNEAAAIGDVVREVPDEIKGERVETYVIDGGSDDGTREIAREAGAEVIDQYYRGGKGAAVRQAFDEIDAEVYVFLDGDGTYDPAEMDEVAGPVLAGEYDHVVGSRLENREKGAITRLNLMGNWLFNMLVRRIYGADIRDMLSGYRAVSRELVERTPVFRDGFGIETEMTIQTLDADFRIHEVPIRYARRQGSSKLSPFRDGMRILGTIIWMFRDTRPMLFFSLLSLVFLLLGLYPGMLAVNQKLSQGVITNVVPPLVASVCLLFALQTFLFGLIADQQKKVLKTLHRRR